MASTAFLAIAYTTALLKSLLEHGLARNQIADLVGGVSVAALLPEQAGSAADEQAHLNLFLSHVVPNTRVRSLDVRSERPAAPLALDLHYIVTADSAKELHTEMLLGYVGEFFRERPSLCYQARSWRVLGNPALKQEATAGPSVAWATAELAAQIESIAIRPLFQSPDELSKIWSALQVKYRPSLSYKVEFQPEWGGRPAGLAGAQ